MKLEKKKIKKKICRIASESEAKYKVHYKSKHRKILIYFCKKKNLIKNQKKKKTKAKFTIL